jgi:hypothetical protein
VKDKINKKRKVNNNKKFSNDNDNKNKKTFSNKYLIIGITVLIAIVGIAISYPYFASSNTNLDKSSSDKSNLLGDWHDIHGVGIFNAGVENNSIYLATHNGLYNKKQNSSWVKVGNDKSDLMGFVINPKQQGVMYSSGHPVNGGNLGFRMSSDSGKTWQTISSVTDNPIDFHAMSISPVNNDILYGSPGGGDALFITQDEGKTWSAITSIPSQIMSIAADPLDSNGVYIGTGSGIFYSNDQGNNWKKIESELIRDSVVSGLGFNQNNELFAYIMPTTEEGSNNQNGYIIKSDEAVKNWTKTNGQIPNVKAAWKFALGQNGETYTIVSQQTIENDIASSVYKSIDNGKTWILEGTNREKIL